MQTDNAILQQPCYRCKVTNYDETLGELSFWYDEPLGREERREALLYPLVREKKVVSEKPIDPDAETNNERAQRRAKSKVRKLVMTMKADRILTLTQRENIVDIVTYNKLFVRFIKEVHKKYPEFKYVGVAEVQKRGAWHYHLAVSGWQDVGYLRACWRKFCDGNIDVTNPKTNGNHLKASPQIAGYLTKYMSKAFADNNQLDKHRYRSSKGIELQQFTIWLTAQSWSEAQIEAGNLIADTYGQIGSYFFADDWNNGWFASWSFNNSKRASTAKPVTS